MKIRSLRLISYGKFQNKVIELSDGVNIIFGKNESGKSTVMAFIKAMLYGFSGRGADPWQSDRKKYIPWQGEFVAGEIDLITDEGQELRILREMGKTQKQDKLSSFKIKNGEAANFDPLNEVGVGEEAFLKTLYIKQLSAPISGEDSEIARKLINLTYSGEEDVSYHAAALTIQEEMKRYKRLRGDDGIIKDLQGRLAALNSELEQSRKQKADDFSLAARARELEEAINRHKEKLASFEERRKEQRLYEEFARLDSAIGQVKRLKGEIAKFEEEQKAIERDVEILSPYSDAPEDIIYEAVTDTTGLEAVALKKRKKAKGLSVCAWILATAAALSTAAGAYLTELLFVPGGIFGAAALLCFIFAAAQRGACRGIDEERNSAEEKNIKIRAELLKYDAADVKEYAEKKAVFEGKLLKKRELEEKTAAFREELKAAEKFAQELQKEAGDVRPEKIPCTAAELDREEKTLREMIEKCISEKAGIDGFLGAGSRGGRTPGIIETERDRVLESLTKAEAEHEALSLALEALHEVYSRMSSDFTPKLNARASQILSEITGGEYETLYLDKKYSVNLEKDGTKSLAYFSSGTIDQVYLSVRLAIADILFGREKPVFIDDGLIQYDEDREERTLRFLAKRAKEGQQTVLFSCRRFDIGEQGINVIQL